MKIVNPKLLQQKIEWFPHPKQQEIIQAFLDGKRKIVVSAGIRSGKSMTCAFIVLLSLLSEGKEILVVSPSYALTDRVLSNVKLWLNKLFSVPVSMQSKPFPQIKINWSGGVSYVEGKSAESPEQLLGKSYDLIVVDEASRIQRKIFENYLLPRVGEREGTICMISTPLKKDWFFEEFQKAKEDKASFQFSTIENPHYPVKEYEAIKKQLPKQIFNREFNAVFSDEITSIFPNAHDCVNPDLPREKIKDHFHYIGLDLAKEEDFTGIVVADATTQEIIEIQKWQKIKYPAQAERIKGIAERFNPCRVIIDARYVGAMLGDTLRNEGVWVEDFVSSGTISDDWRKKGSKALLVEKAMGLFESRSISIPNHSELLDQLSTYSYVISDAGNIKYGVPSGLKDDLADALFLSLWNLEIKSISRESAMDKQLKEGWKQKHRTIQTYI